MRIAFVSYILSAGVALGKLTHIVDMRVPGRVSAAHLVDGKHGRFAVVGVEMLVERQGDCGDLLAGVPFGAVGRMHVDRIDTLCFQLLAARTGCVHTIDDVEADAEHQKRREHDEHGGYCHTKTVCVDFVKLIDFVVCIFNSVVARGGDVEFAGRAVAHLPCFGAFSHTVDAAGIGGIGRKRRGHCHGINQRDAVGIVDSDPVVPSGHQCEAGVESATGRFVVGPENHMLALGDVSVDIAQGHGIHLGLCGVGGEEHSRNLKRREIGVEQLDPGSALAVIVDGVRHVLDHHLIDTQTLAGLRRADAGADHKGDGEYKKLTVHIRWITGVCCRAFSGDW